MVVAASEAARIAAEEIQFAYGADVNPEGDTATSSTVRCRIF